MGIFRVVFFLILQRAMGFLYIPFWFLQVTFVVSGINVADVDPSKLIKFSKGFFVSARTDDGPTRSLFLT